MNVLIPPPADCSENHKPSGGLYAFGIQPNIVSGTWTKVECGSICWQFNDGIEDTGNFWILPGVAGLYHITGIVTFDDVVALKKYGVKVKYSGSVVQETYAHSGIADQLAVPFSVYVWLGPTDYIEIFAAQFSGVNTVDIIGDEYQTFFQVIRVR